MRLFIFVFLLITFSCNTETKNPIEKALDSQKQNIRQVVDSIDQYEVQIKLTTINRLKDSIAFEDYEFQVDDSTYFYPASTVKFPLSVLVLEKLSSQDSITLDTPFYVEGDSSIVTFRQQIRDIFAVSSNDTYNRLFEFYGKDNYNKRMKELGLTPSRFSHRLSTSDAYNLTTKPLIFQMDDSTLVSTESIINNPIEKLELQKIRKGKGYYSNGILVEEPMDFSEKNYLPIRTIHQLMKMVYFPESPSVNSSLKLNNEHEHFLKEAMKIYPKDEGYELPEYYDGYGKFFLYGDTKESIPDHIKIHNKVGYAYGYLTDCAYIIDESVGLEYILTATIHVNRDAIFNDDVYEYEEVGIPFLAELGREIHQILIENE
ncbi:MAG: serine hydrolase [bacterium]